ncbi:hypothetical protein GCM10009007_15800 [Formosimonas limnophila]|uniref:chorismate mutase n=1 Tax=Formosimonas limnophila TaxID=1384487 RepID=A0A8J3CLC2_9BURK|nr:isochorismate lyase [Formosimonas limnophila]GHA75483.1 hypothetical protein GCM10009007_15800 [Formosimonas limnophila]
MENHITIAPDKCTSMLDIRSQIDHIDQQVVCLLGQRYLYVQAASAFKTSETAVRAPERFATMLTQRRTWATENGLNPEVIEKLFTDLVNHFIDEEMKKWQAEQKPRIN